MTNKNFFFPYNDEDEEELEEYDRPHAHLTNDWYDIMGSMYYIYWEKSQRYRSESY